MPIEFFGFSLGRKKKSTSTTDLSTKADQVGTFVKPDIDYEGSTIIDSGAGYFGTYMDMDGSEKTDIDYIKKYREMATHPEVESAIEDICNESIVHVEDRRNVDINLEMVDLSDNIKKRITEEYDSVYSLLNFENKGFEIFRRWYVDGKLYYHMVVDPKKTKNGVLDIKYVDPTKIRKIVEVKKETKNGVETVVGSDEFFLYKEKPEERSSGGVRIAPEAVCYATSGLFDAGSKRVTSYLHKAIKPLNQLRMIEDAVVIYRISRAPERRIFYIDVGSLPKTKAEQYVKSIMNKYRNKLVYDAKTGAIRDDKRHLSMLEDFWLPRREGGKGTEISTLDGGQNLGEMDDVFYFQKRLFQSLGVPKSRLEQDVAYGMGRASEINRDEVKFMKFIDRLRSKFNDVFKTLLKTQCILKGVMTEDEWNKVSESIKFDYARDNHFAELKDYEILNERMSILRDVNDYIGKYYSVDWVRKNILRQSEREIEELDSQIAKEREEGIITDDGNEGY